MKLTLISITIMIKLKLVTSIRNNDVIMRMRSKWNIRSKYTEI